MILLRPPPQSRQSALSPGLLGGRRRLLRDGRRYGYWILNRLWSRNSRVSGSYVTRRPYLCDIDDVTYRSPHICVYVDDTYMNHR